ncbi:hypothetical protein [Gemmiger formicilis]|uniref:hypothetical protein n=1 Tax=Gemmiger formicilis TaxID=745368 RepID=UPI003993A5F1
MRQTACGRAMLAPTKPHAKTSRRDIFAKKKNFSQKGKSQKSHTQSGDRKEHCAVIFKDRNKTHHPSTLLPMTLPTFYLLYHAGAAVSMQTGFLQK